MTMTIDMDSDGSKTTIRLIGRMCAEQLEELVNPSRRILSSTRVAHPLWRKDKNESEY
jgi:hypothetical protein